MCWIRKVETITFPPRPPEDALRIFPCRPVPDPDVEEMGARLSRGQTGGDHRLGRHAVRAPALPCRRLRAGEHDEDVSTSRQQLGQLRLESRETFDLHNIRHFQNGMFVQLRPQI